jgi:hypothetical protein
VLKREPRTPASGQAPADGPFVDIELADAMDCELVYYIIPKQKAIVGLARKCAEARGKGLVESIKAESMES